MQEGNLYLFSEFVRRRKTQQTDFDVTFTLTARAKCPLTQNTTPPTRREETALHNIHWLDEKWGDFFFVRSFCMFPNRKIYAKWGKSPSSIKIVKLEKSVGSHWKIYINKLYWNLGCLDAMSRATQARVGRAFYNFFKMGRWLKMAHYWPTADVVLTLKR